MTPAELLAVLREFHRDKLAMRERHVAVARYVSDYQFNNAYQYMIAREDVHLSWLEAAIAELDGAPEVVPEPALPPRGKKDSFTPLMAEDARAAGDFVGAWRDRVAAVAHARHRIMMDVILGEVLEHKRFLDQMLAGRQDVLGRRANGPKVTGTGDGVLPVRWLE